MKEDSRATSPIPGMLSAKSLSRKRIFALQMSKDTAIKSNSRNNAVHPSMKSTHELTPNICRRRANAGGNRAGETFSSSSQPSPIHFEIFFREELRNWGQKKSKRLRWMIPHNTWEFGHYWLKVGKKWVLAKLEGTKSVSFQICEVEVQTEMYIPWKIQEARDEPRLPRLFPTESEAEHWGRLQLRTYSLHIPTEIHTHIYWLCVEGQNPFSCMELLNAWMCWWQLRMACGATNRGL